MQAVQSSDGKKSGVQAPVGLLAGSGRFPVLFAEKARSLGIPVVCVGISHEAPPELADIVHRFSWAGVAQLGRERGRVDDSQSVGSTQRGVLAGDAIEGTDRAIARAGELCRSGGFVVVKVAKPRQDMRFDVPTIGCSTVEHIHRAGGKVLAI